MLFRSRAKELYLQGKMSLEEYLVVKEDGRFSKIIVVAAVIAVMIYTAATFHLEYLNVIYNQNVQLPLEVNSLYFAFWTVEIVMLATIKKSKVRNKYEKGVSDERGHEEKVDEP